MEVRWLGTGDEASYLALRAKSIEESPDVATPEIRRELGLVGAGPGELFKTYQQEQQRVLGVYYSGSLVGMIALNANLSGQHQHDIQMWGLYVMPRLRGTPVSQLLLEDAIAWCRHQQGKVAVWVWFPKGNVQAFRFFGRNYFSVVRPGERAAGTDPIPATDLIFMEYFLGS